MSARPIRSISSSDTEMLKKEAEAYSKYVQFSLPEDNGCVIITRNATYVKDFQKTRCMNMARQMRKVDALRQKLRNKLESKTS